MPTCVSIALENVSRTLFGADVSDHTEAVADALAVVMDEFLSRLQMLVPPPDWLPTPGNLRLRAAIKHLDEIILRFIDHRRRDGGGVTTCCQCCSGAGPRRFGDDR